ncbi:bifunctional 2-polyprenyl-6-hydroxyphenol methylase/3-demethylubiquinol 3-O-methyltransferase UbiG [Inhella gelatinilytica]|uniref:Ubiquinone biosynthesis O-methyltransferase n=1 Tax=Inhella gelatinilytica TaxID=2795030 RepID=A0A931IYU1_9BURK|nr:bifunctional 2-polyprenyl-6-hydroxyphenol methylase/3-demethylubiquinol 3-O-methyltransferase UbiG [Inhella gelatinilytica]MBH9553500.1 bifunctional 2-polyprenyl-6-hydroxyphenol methylase/3-demethylubiquinol 3-O-methyltransferase UbiG [Inhella gelatinilytica]
MEHSLNATPVNADPAELAKFGDAAHRWWDPESEFKPLHQINPLRLDWIEGLSPFQGQKVLDVGCGGGLLSEGMARRGAAEVLGIDLSAKALGVAELHAMDGDVHNLRYREVAVERLAQECPGAFDAVTCLEMLEHVPEPASVVRACAELVKPGGWVFFSTLHRNFKAYALAVVAAERLLKMLPTGTHHYDRFIRPSELAGFARQAGLVPLHMVGLSYNPLNQRYSLGNDTDVNYLLACRRL